MIEYEDVYPPKYFEILPIEVRVDIYSLLPYSDLLAMRGVNRKIRKEIDDHMDFHLKFDQSNCTTRLKRLLRRRLKSCHIVRFTRTLNFTSKIFWQPNRVKKLTFDGLIAKRNLLKILTQCCSVEQLIFTHETLGINDLFDLNHFIPCLQRLTSVTHLNLQLLRYPLGDPFKDEKNVEAFLEATFPSLKSFRLYFSLWGNYSSVCKFVARHYQTLKELELQVGDRGDSRNTETYLKIFPMCLTQTEMMNFKSLKLVKFRIRDDVLNLNQEAKDLIINMLLKQQDLQVLEFYSPGELSWLSLKKLVNTNENTLTELVVYNLQSIAATHNESTVDMSAFSKCSQLKTLALSCTSSNGADPNVVGSVVLKMTNLQTVSTSIKSLHLTGFTLDGQELVYLSDRKNNKLKEVLIADAGTMKYSDVLDSFLKNCNDLSYLNVRPVILQAGNEQLWWKEVRKLSKLYERFMGISYDPIDDLEGFEANITDSDKDWLKSYDPTLSVYSSSSASTSITSASASNV